MNTLDKILEQIKLKQITELRFLQDNGFNKTAMSDWKAGRNKSYEKHISKIADYFGVSVDYLLGRTDEPNPPSDDDLLNLLRKNKNQATIIGFGDGRHIKTDMTYEDFEELEAMWRALKEKRKK